MNRKPYLLLLLMLLGITCSKKSDQFNEKDDFSGKGILQGRLSYSNLYSGDGQAKPLPRKKVKLAYAPSDMLNFLYSDSTDVDGYFSFENLKENQLYDVFFTDSIDGSLYTALKKVSPGDTKINLVAVNDTVRQNGLYLETRLNNQPLGDVRICIFNNQTAFRADTCNNNYRSDVSDNSGRKIFYNLLPGSYFARAYKRIGSDLYLDTATLVLAAAGIQTVKFNLMRVKSVNVLEVAVADRFGLPVSAARVGVYNSRSIFLLDSLGTNFLRSTTSSSTGIASIPDLTAGKYYIRAFAQAGNSMLTGQDSTFVSATGPSSQPVFVR